MTDFTFSILSNDTYPWRLLLLADPNRNQIESYISESTVIGMIDSSKIVGVSVIKQLNNESAEIMNIAIDEKYQGMGLGKLLITRSVDECATRGVKSVEIGTGNSSIAQLYLYQKMGFRIVGIIRDHFVKNYPDPIFENGIQCRDMIRLRREL
jgi:ribosomal protein S18 acetylase RimI-like enzyme